MKVIYVRPSHDVAKPKVDVQHVFKDTVPHEYNVKNATSKVRPMMQLTDRPNPVLRERARQELRDFQKARSA